MPDEGVVRGDPVLAAVMERDVDLLLIEEFLSSQEFQRWTLKRVVEPAHPELIDTPFDSIECRHSVSRTGEGTGETDIEVKFVQDDAGKSRQFTLLIEDKIDAEFTANQAGRYRMAADEVRRDPSSLGCSTVLVCPERYGRGGTEAGTFDAVVTYEEIAEHL